MQVYVVVYEINGTEEVNFETGETKDTTYTNVVGVYSSLDKVRERLADYNYHYNSHLGGMEFVLPNNDYYDSDDCCIYVYSFELDNDEDFDQLSPHDLYRTK